MPETSIKYSSVSRLLGLHHWEQTFSRLFTAIDAAIPVADLHTVKTDSLSMGNAIMQTQQAMTHWQTTKTVGDTPVRRLHKPFLWYLIVSLALLAQVGVASAAIDVNKSFAPGAIYPSQTSVMTIELQNSSTSPALNVAFSNTFTSGIFVAPTPGIVNTCGGTPTLSNTSTGGKLVFSGGTVPAAVGATPGRCSIKVNVTTQVKGTFVDTIPAGAVTATVNGSPQASLQATSATLTSLIDPIGVTITTNLPAGSDGSSILRGGETGTMTVTLTNTNPLALTNVGMSWPVSAQGAGAYLHFVPGTGTSSCGGSFTATDVGTAGVWRAQSDLALSGVTIPAGGSCTLTMTVETRAYETSLHLMGTPTLSLYNNTLTSAQGASNGSTATRLFWTLWGLYISKTFNDTTTANIHSLTSPATATMKVQIYNYNKNTATLNLTDTLPTSPGQMTVTSVTSNTCGGTTATGTKLTLTGGSLPGLSASCEIAATVSMVNDGTYENIIKNGNLGAYQFSDAKASITKGSGLLAISKTTPYAYASTGDEIVYTYNFTNMTDATTGIDATNIRLRDNFIASLTNQPFMVMSQSKVINNTCTGGTVASPSGSTYFQIGGFTVPKGVTCAISVQVGVIASGDDFKGFGVDNFDDIAAKTNAADLTQEGIVYDGGGSTNLMVSSPIVFKMNGEKAMTPSVSFSPDTVAPGGVTTIEYKLSFLHGTDQGLENIQIHDTLPTGMTIASPLVWSSSCGGTLSSATGSSAINFSGGSIAGDPLSAVYNTSGYVKECSLKVQVKAPTTLGGYTATLNAGAYGTPEASLEATAEKVGEIVPYDYYFYGFDVAANLTVKSMLLPINKQFMTPVIKGGAPSRVRITIANTDGSAPALSNVSLTDSFSGTGIRLYSDVNAKFGDATGAVTTACNSAIITGAPGANSIAMTGAKIGQGATCYLEFNVTATVGGNHINSIGIGDVTSAEGVNNDQAVSATLTVDRALNVGKGFSPTVIGAGGTSQLRLDIINSNASPITYTGAATALIDEMPAGISISSIVSNSCGGTATIITQNGNAALKLSGGTFSSESVCTIIANVTSNTVGNYINTIPVGAITTVEGATSADAVSATLSVVAPPSIAKSFNPTIIALGKTSLITFTLTNTGSTPLTGISFTDVLTNMTLTSNAVMGGTCPGVIANPAGGASSFAVTGGTIPANSSCTITIGVKSTVAGTHNNVTSGVDTDQTGVGAPSNTAQLTVLAPPTSTKSFTPTSITTSGVARLDVTLTNPNTQAITLQTSPYAFQDHFPTGMTIAATPNPTTTCTGGSFQNNANTGAVAANDVGFTFLGGTIPANGYCTVSINVKVAAEGSLSNVTTAIDTTNAGSGLAATGVLTVQNISSISGTLFNDKNADAVYWGTDTPLPGVTLTLYKDSGTPADLTDDVFVANTTTNASGFYHFVVNDISTTYRVTVDLVTGGLPTSGLTIAHANPEVGINASASPVTLDFPFQTPVDRSDTPISYGEATHIVKSTIRMGAAIDYEFSSIASANADSDGTDDDGVSVFPTLVEISKTWSIPAANFNLTGTGKLHGWIDANGDGDFLDAGEYAVVNVTNGTPAGPLAWSGMDLTAVGSTFVRLRFTSDTTITSATPSGAATDGEVEDYKVTITPATMPFSANLLACSLTPSAGKFSIGNVSWTHNLPVGTFNGAGSNAYFGTVSPLVAGSGMTYATGGNNYATITAANRTTNARAFADKDYVDYQFTMSSTAPGTGYMAVLEFLQSNDAAKYPYKVDILVSTDPTFATADTVVSNQTVSSTGVDTPVKLAAQRGVHLEPNKTYYVRVLFYGASSSSGNLRWDDFRIYLGDCSDPTNTGLPGGGTSAPVVGAFGTTTYVENTGYTPVAPNITVSNGFTYDGGYLEFALSNLLTTDVLGFPTPADVNAVGAISVVGDGVYQGNGTGRDMIGKIDPVLNGTNGQKLRINFETSLSNGTFENGTLTGWTATNAYYPMAGDTGLSDIVATANAVPSSGLPSGYVPPASSGSYVAKLDIFGTVGVSCGTAHGPVLESSAFSANAGSLVSVDWAAVPTADNYDVYGYIKNTSTGALTQVFYERGASKTWGTTTVSVPAAGTYTFLFVGGTQDATCGTAVGATLYIDNAKLVSISVTDTIVQRVARALSFYNTGDDPTVTSATRVSVPVTISAKAKNGQIGSASSTIAITPLMDAPVINAGPDVIYTNATTAIASALTITDVDDTQMAAASVTIIAPDATDALSLVGATATTASGVTTFTGGSIPAGVTASFDSSTKVLTITGKATIAQYQALLRTVAISTSNAKIVRFAVTDANSDATTPGSASDDLSVTGYDRSDAPATYGSPTHNTIIGIRLGNVGPDFESSVTPLNGTGDDITNIDDEEGVTLPTAFVPSLASTITISAVGSGGYLQGWVDWNRNGNFADAGEQIITNLQDNGAGDLDLTLGTITVSITPPAGASLGASYARFRWSTTAGLSATAAATNGEVEDYPVMLSLATDRGDAPASYGDPTHLIVAGMRLGNNAPDVDPVVLSPLDGTGDNVTGTNDEDGVSAFPTLIASNTSYSIPTANLSVTGTGTLHAWIDFDKNGAFTASEYASVAVTSGTLAGPLNWTGITVGSVGTTYARLRFTSTALTDTAGTTAVDERATMAATNGEVEDYAVSIVSLDHGDAPATFGDPTHQIAGSLKLGAVAPDAELTAQSNATATGDNTTGSNDEDGVSAFPTLIAGNTSYSIPAANLAATGTGTLHAWIDFDKNGAFTASEYASVAVTSGTLAGPLNWSGITVGATGTTYARFRFTSTALTDTAGTTAVDERATMAANDGEVEDYAVNIVSFDHGDAPATFGDPTHQIAGNLKLGATAPDAETAAATPLDGTGDNVTGTNDEDGVSSFPTLNTGATSYTLPAANITATGTGTLHAWIDFDKNGAFTASEYKSVSVTGGTLAGPLSWTGITVGSAGTTYARLRFTTTSLTDTAGTTAVDERATMAANDGEVEDYAINIIDQLDLSLTKTASVVGALPGANVSFTLTVSNAGAAPASGVVVTDLLPAGLTYTSAATTNGSYTSATGLWTLANPIAAGGTATLTLNTTMGSSGAMRNRAWISASAVPDPDSDPATGFGVDDLGDGKADDDEAEVTVGRMAAAPPACNPLTSFAEYDGGVPAGGTLVATSTAQNGEVLTITSTPPTVGNFNAGRPIYGYMDGTNTNMLVSRGGGLHAKTTWSFSQPRTDVHMAVANIGSSGEQQSVIGYLGSTPVYPLWIGLNTGAIVKGDYGEEIYESDGLPEASGLFTFPSAVDRFVITNLPSATNDFIDTGLRGCKAADLSLLKTADLTALEIGQPVTFTLKVRNAWKYNAPNVKVTDVLPAGLTYIASTPSQGSYDASTGVWTVGTLVKNGTATLKLTANPTASGAIKNTATITSSDLPDPDSKVTVGINTDDYGDGVVDDDEAWVTVNVSGYQVSGKVFNDSNANGTDNSELGIKEVTIVLEDTVAHTCRSTRTGADGRYTFSGLAANKNYVLYEAASEKVPVPQTCPPAANDPNGYASSTANSQTLTLTTSSVTGINFGDVRAPSFTLDNEKVILPNTTVAYPHIFQSYTDGTVAFSVVDEQADPSDLTWSTTLYVDTNCDAKLDKGDVKLTSAYSVNAGDKVCLLAKVSAPANATSGAVHTLTLQSDFTYGAGATGIANDIQTHTDITKTSAGTTTSPVEGSGKLNLEKTVWNVTRNIDGTVAKPGETLRYTILYENVGNGLLDELAVHDTVPTFTTLVAGSVLCDSTPPELTSCTPTSTSSGVEWTFVGKLKAGSKGSVVYEVKVD